IRGDKADNLEQAIASYTMVLQVRNSQNFPEDWAGTQHNIAVAYSDRIRGEKADNLEQSIASSTAILEVYTRTAFPQQWAMTQNSLGNAYLNRIRGEKAENLEEAIAYYTAALEVYTQEAFPEQWAMTQNNLGIAYSKRIRGDKAKNLEQAISHYTFALEVRTRERFPEEWVDTQSNLGGAYSERIQGNKAENLEKALDYYTAASTVYTREAFPEKWAGLQNNLGGVYSNRIRGDKADNLEQAISYYTAASAIYTRESFPENLANLQNNLGSAYFNRIRGDKAENIERAIAYCNAGLEFCTRESFPEQWANLQNNLGATYSIRLKKNKAENLEWAISSYTAALEVYSQKAFPEKWATTKTNLGVTYSDRIRENKAENLECAIACYNEALEVLTHESFPEQWATTQNNLGGAYLDRIWGKKSENLKRAITCYTAALKVYTHEIFPKNHAGTSFNLGLAYQNSGEFQLAYHTFAYAIDTVESLRAEIQSGDEAKHKLAEEWSKLYRAMVEVCIGLKNYTAAIEYADRSKTRNLVELLATRDLYPKGDIPEPILNELDRLRREITIEQRQIEITERNRTLGGMLISDEFRDQNSPTFPTPDRTRLNQLRQELDKLIKRDIAPHDSNFALTQKVEPLPFSDIQELVNDGKTALIEWYISGEKFLHTFIVTSQNQSPTIWQSSHEDLQNFKNWVTGYLNGYYNTKQQWRDSLEEKLGELGQILHIDEILKWIPTECEKLILIPHRYLHLFPLHALEGVRTLKSGTSSQKLPLIDLFPGGVSYAPSCQLLQITSRNAKSNADLQHLVAFHNPTDDLIFTDMQMETIRRYFDSADILAKQDATKEALQQQITQNRGKALPYLHFFCHGYFN
ncbi:MAG: CHAT domain-containing protein, partial [Planktothrix sp.]